jgi:hypothetical protein
MDIGAGLRETSSRLPWPCCCANIILFLKRGGSSLFPAEKNITILCTKCIKTRDPLIQPNLLLIQHICCCFTHMHHLSPVLGTDRGNQTEVQFIWPWIWFSLNSMNMIMGDLWFLWSDYEDYGLLTDHYQHFKGTYLRWRQQIHPQCWERSLVMNNSQFITVWSNYCLIVSSHLLPWCQYFVHPLFHLNATAQSQHCTLLVCL